MCPTLAGLNNKDIHAPWLARTHRLQAAGVEIGKNYPAPIVDHAQARAETLARYAVGEKSGLIAARSGQHLTLAVPAHRRQKNWLQ
jgi:deoxyribodipyrimidine photo-lyase